MSGRRVVGGLATAVLLCACGGQISDTYTIDDEPFELEAVPGSDLQQVRLDPAAVTRLGIEVAPVEQGADGLLVPSGALWMDVEGRFWVYVNTGPNTYLRDEVDLVDDDATRALLASGPPPGTEVVVFGVPELFGTEVGVGK